MARQRNYTADSFTYIRDNTPFIVQKLCKKYII